MGEVMPSHQRQDEIFKAWQAWLAEHDPATVEMWDLLPAIYEAVLPQGPLTIPYRPDSGHYGRSESRQNQWDANATRQRWPIARSAPLYS